MAGDPNCLLCEHFYITWDLTFPRGCRIFGIKTKELPSVEVRRATSQGCPSFKGSLKREERKSL